MRLHVIAEKLATLAPTNNNIRAARTVRVYVRLYDAMGETEAAINGNKWQHLWYTNNSSAARCSGHLWQAPSNLIMACARMI